MFYRQSLLLDNALPFFVTLQIENRSASIKINISMFSNIAFWNVVRQSKQNYSPDMYSDTCRFLSKRLHDDPDSSSVIVHP